MNRPPLHRIHVAVALAASALLLGCAGMHGTAPPSADDAALREVVETFRTAIVDKNKPAFVDLFFSDRPERVTWQAVVDDRSLERIKRQRPQALKARYRPDNNFVAFIDRIVDSKRREEEEFANVVVDTDGEIASVSFDYVYKIDGRATNHGREKWLLVRTEQGWKIASVVYTIRLPEEDGG